MKLTKYLISTLSVVIALTVAGQSQNQSLGDYARGVKKTTPATKAKRTPRVYDNDNLPTQTTLSIVGNESAESDAAEAPEREKSKDAAEGGEKTKDAGDAAKSSEASKPESGETPKTDSKTGEKEEDKPQAQFKEGQSSEDRDKAVAALEKKLESEKDKVALASRELDVLQREYQLKVSEFYSDTARRVQNPNGLADVESQYKEQIADKQKQLEDAKTELSNMQEEGRREGAPNSALE